MAKSQKGTTQTTNRKALNIIKIKIIGMLEISSLYEDNSSKVVFAKLL